MKNKEKNQTQLGKLGEYLVIVELLKLDIEAYPSNIKNQEDWDITIILNDLSVKRIQVKTTNLQNNSTNNSLKGTDKNYDFLVIVIQDIEQYRFLILTKEEVEKEKGTNKDFSTSQKEEQKYIIKKTLKIYEQKWEKLTLTHNKIE